MQNIRDRLLELQDKKYQKFHSGLCPNVDNIIGVRIPILRSLAKEIAKQDAYKYLENADIKFYEEKMLYGFVIGYKNMKLEERINYLDKFVPMIDNWAVCDCTVSTFKFVEKNLEEILNYLQKYINSNKEYELRFAIVMLMDYYIKEKYIDEVLKIYNNIQHEGYYVKMAVAWAISECYIKFPEKTMKFLNNNNLDKFTYNKALQKMIESYRIDDKTKEKLRSMKVK